ncbi:MAG TPA: hypothetical protein VF824_06775 [Thermoanaerobaculia bacterium]|jgi:VWFA-related protein
MRRLAMLLLMMPLVARAQFKESIEVVRILADVRVTDADGEPLDDLHAGDFTVRIGGKPAAVESATWVADVRSDADPSIPKSGRLLIVFVQTDFARESARIHGQLKFLPYAEELIAGLEPEDRVAVVSFDSHLKFRLDFTSDKDRVREALRASVALDEPPTPPIVASPSLAPRLDARAMRRAVSSERGLTIVADALRSVEGAKTLLLLGWGLGQLSAVGVTMKQEYLAARRALDAARVSVFALDTTNADYHDLELGLDRAARDTGGFYAKTHVLPRIAISRLQRTLAGHYELELRRPNALRPGTHDMSVRVSRRGAVVLAPATYVDQH